MLKAGIISIVVGLCLSLAAAVGYVSNIVKLTQCDFKESYKCEVLRVVGLVPPVGVIMGYISNEKLGEPAKK